MAEYTDSDEGPRIMATRFKEIMRPLIAEAINDQLTPTENRQDKFESVLTRVDSEMTRIDINMDYLAKRFKDEDDAESKSYNASLGGGTSTGING